MRVASVISNLFKCSECVRSYAGFRNNVAWNVHYYWFLLLIGYYYMGWLNGWMEFASWFMTKCFIGCMFIVINSSPCHSVWIRNLFYTVTAVYKPLNSKNTFQCIDCLCYMCTCCYRKCIKLYLLSSITHRRCGHISYTRST